MADMDQHENLKDVLGFDPNASSDEPIGGGGMPRPKDERYGWPENWKEIFDLSLETDLGIGATNVDLHDLDINNLPLDNKVGRFPIYDLDYKDPDNLFAIETGAVYFVNDIKRAYFRFNPSRNFFMGATYLWISDDENAYPEAVTFGDNNMASGVVFKPYWDDCRFWIRMGNRKISVEYHETFTQVRFKLLGLDEKTSEEAGFRGGELGFGVNEHARVENKSKGTTLEMEDLDEEYFIVVRKEQGKVKDRIELPKRINTDAFLNRWFPQVLRKNVKNHSLELDVSWKGVDFAHEAGIRWDAVEDDSLHSLTPIPPPAPEDQ